MRPVWRDGCSRIVPATVAARAEGDWAGMEEHVSQPYLLLEGSKGMDECGGVRVT